VILPATTVGLAIALLVGRSCREPRNPLILVLCVWALALTLTALPVLDYQVNYSFAADIFIAFCLIAIAVGYRLTRRAPRDAPPAVGSGLDFDLTVARAAAAAGILGNLLLLLHAVQAGVDLSPSYLAANLQSIREENFSLAQAGGGSFLLTLGGFLSPASFLFIALATRLDMSKKLVWANFASIVLVALFFYGGRQTIIVMILLALISAWLLRKRIIRWDFKTVAVATVVIIGGWYMATSFAATRQGSDFRPDLLLKVTGRAEYSQLLEGPARSSYALRADLLQYSYFSSPIPGLVFYMQSPQVPSPLYGQYSFPIPAQLGRKVVRKRDPEAWQKARKSVFRPFSSAGYVENAWATMLRDLFADFGYVGAILFCGLFGLGLAWSRNAFESTGSALYLAIESYLALTLAFGAFQSVIWTNYVSYGFYFALVALLFRRLFGEAASNSAGVAGRRGTQIPTSMEGEPS
jgi:hypothetical protein